MQLAGRVGDKAKCPTCRNEGEAKEGSPDVFINDQPALRVGDPGKHQGCSGDAAWNADKGSRSVFINGLPVHRVGDVARYGDSDGQLIEGSPDVFIGDVGGGEAKPVPHDQSLTLDLTDALDRPLKEATVTVSCPHKPDTVHKFSGTATVTGLCSGSTVTVDKVLQRGTWDPGGSSGELLPPTIATPGDNPASNVVHAPVSPGTPSDTHQARIVKPAAPTAKVKLTTVHNWAELVFKAFGYTMPTAATEISILGVREASLSGKGSTDTLEAEASAGHTDKVTFTRETRDVDFSKNTGNTHATTWNDLLFVSFTSSTPDHAQHVEVFECTIDAGSYENVAGMPVTLEGRLYRARPGYHITSKYPGNDIALHIFTETYGKIALARECTGVHRTFHEIASAKNPATAWKFARVEDNASIHMHFGSELGKVGGWSTGCTVLRHHLFIKNSKGVRVQDPNATRYKRFMELYRKAANKQKIPYLVVSSKYVRTYAEWARLLDQSPDEAAKTESVLLKDKLVAAPGQKGRYLPSFVTEGFAREVNALAAAPTTSKTHAANLRASMELVTFTLAV